MGFGDKLKDIRKQAAEAVAEHKDQIQGAVEVAGTAANQKTRGRYANQISKFGQKASAAVEKLGAEGEPGGEPGGAPTGQPAAAGAPASSGPPPVAASEPPPAPAAGSEATPSAPRAVDKPDYEPPSFS